MKSLTYLILVLLAVFKISYGGEYVKNGSRTYYIGWPQRYNWYQSYQYCAALGMFLIDLRTEAEHKRIVDILKVFHKQNNLDGFWYWTSGTDLSSENHFYWMTTGQSFVFRNWYSGQPNKEKSSTGGIQNCVELSAFPSNAFKWFDNFCSINWSFICRDTMDVAISKSDGCSSEMDTFA